MKQNKVQQDANIKPLVDEESYGTLSHDNINSIINEIYVSGADQSLLSNQQPLSMRITQRKNGRQESSIPLLNADAGDSVDQRDEEISMRLLEEQIHSSLDQNIAEVFNKQKTKKNKNKDDDEVSRNKTKGHKKQKLPGAYEQKHTLAHDITFTPGDQDVQDNNKFEDNEADDFGGLDGLKPPQMQLDKIDSSAPEQNNQQNPAQIANSSQPVGEMSMKWWAMEIGEKKEEHVGTLEEILNNNDNEVFPMSLSYTQTQIVKMRTFRFIVLFLCLVALIPHDFYLMAHRRIGYFGTDTYEEIISIDQMNGRFYFNIKNCHTYLRHYNTQQDKIKLVYGFEFGNSFKQNNTYLEIKSSPSQTCIVNVYLPSNTVLPQLIFNISGGQDNTQFHDQFMDGTALNFQNGLIIQGETAFITLQNHAVSNLNISFTFSICKLSNIEAKVKNVTILTGLYSDYLPSKFGINYVSANQSSGHICLYSPKITDVSGSNCSVMTDVTVTNKKLCLVNTYMCIDSSSNCTSSKPDSYNYITLKDGPIQIRYGDSAYGTKYDKRQVNRDTVAFSRISNLFLNQSLNNYLLDTQNDRISVLQTVGHEYQRSWVYTNKKVYLDAQFWPLLWGSGTLLAPSMDYNKIIMIDYECPARKQIDEVDLDVNDYYYFYYPQTAASAIAQIRGYSTFYTVASDVLGDIQYSQITINSNPTIIIAICVASIISLIGSLLLTRVVIMVYKILFKKYQEFINSQKSFAVTKKQAALSESKGVAVEESVKFEFQSKQNVLEIRGIFFSRFELMDRTKLKKVYSYKFSIFQIPTLYIDYMLRKQSDSLKEFLLEIYESKQQFSNVKMKLQERASLSILLHDFQRIYSDFCQKFGYIEQNVERDGQETLRQFELSLENQQGQEQAAYANIRYKTNKEKGNKQAQQQNISTIQQFLNEECVYTQFETDYILFEDMKKAYRMFCSLQGKSESEQEQIIGCEELIKFGAIVKQVPPPMRLFGIKYDKSSDPKRIPLIRRPAKKQTNYIANLLKNDGVVANSAYTIVHFIMIMSIPIITPVISYEALREMTKLQEDIYEKPLTFQDFLLANRLDPWWDNIPRIDIFLYIHLYVGLFFILALFELISYYITGFQNNGRFPVEYTIQKKILTKLFYTCIGIFMILYFAFFWFILVWSILAAVLNPNKFLPYAAAALTLFTTIGVKIVQYRLRHRNMIKNLDKVISEKINLVVEQSVAKLKRMTKDKLDKVALPIGNDTFHRELNQHFEQIFDQGSKSVLDGLKDGSLTNIVNLSKIASAALGGLQSTIIEFTIGIITKNKSQINEGLRKLTLELGVDFEFIETISELVQNDYNPDQAGQDELLGQVEIQIKKLFRKLAPNVNVELFGELIKIIIQGDAFPLRRYLNQLDTDQEMYAELFKMLIYCQQDNKSKVKDQLIKFLESAINLNEEELKLLKEKFSVYIRLPKQQRKTSSLITNEEIKMLQKMQENKSVLKSFKTLQRLGDADLTMLMSELNLLDRTKNKTSKLIRFKDNFPLLFMSAYSRRSSTLTTQVINQGFKEILYLKDMLTEEEKNIVKQNYMTQRHYQTVTEKFFLALYIMIKGETMDMKRIGAQVQQRDPNFDSDLLTLVHLSSTNSPQSFQAIIYRLDCASDMDLLMEFYEIINQHNVTPFEICNKLGFDMGKAKIFTSIVFLIHRLMKYELTYKERRNECLKDPTKKLQSKHKAEFKLIRSKIEDSLESLYTKLKINVGAYPTFAEYTVKPPEKERRPDLVLGSRVGSRVGSRQGSREGSRPGSRGHLASEGELNENGSARDTENDEQKKNDDLEKQDDDGGDQQDEEDEEAKRDKINLQKIKYLVKNLFVNFNVDDNAVERDQKIKELWLLISKEKKIIKKFKTDEMFMVARCYAVIIIRNDLLMSQNDKDYIKCVRFLSDFFDIEFEKIDFMVDIISGHPLDVFKVTPKNPTYDLSKIDNDEDDDQKFEFKFNARFENLRTILLQNLFNVDKPVLQYACALWYHYYRFFKQGKSRIPLLMKRFDLSSDFVDILDMIRLNASENHANFDQAFLIKRMTMYLQHGIQSILKKLKKQTSYQDKIQQLNADRNDLLANNYFETNLRLNEEEVQSNYRMMIQNTPPIAFDTAQNLLLVLEDFIKIKLCDKDVFCKLLKMESGENYIRMFNSILRGVQIETSPHSVLYLLSFLSKQIPMFKKGMINWREKKQRINKIDQHLFISFGLVINAFQFKNICKSKEFDKIQIAKILHKYVKLVNSAHNLKKGDKMQYIDEENYKILLQTLYQSNFFQDIAYKLLRVVAGREVPKKLCNSILGLLLGSAINDRSLIRFSVLSMLDGHQLNLKMLEGLGAALVNDIKADSQIKYFCKNLDLDGQYLINLIDFVEKKPNNLPQILFDLLDNITPDQINICASLIHIMKGDIAMVKAIAQRLSIDPKQIIPIFAAATGNLSIMGEFYSDLAIKMDLNSQNTVKYISELAYCRTGCIYQLSQKNSKRFTINDPELVESIYRITYYGKQMFDRTIENFEQITSLENSLSVLARKITKVFGLSSDQGSGINKFVTIVVKACWNDPVALLSLRKKLEKTKREDSIWIKDKESWNKTGVLSQLSDSSINKFLKRKLRMIPDETNNMIDKISIKQKHLINHLKKYIIPYAYKIMENEEITEEFKTQAEKSIIKYYENSKRDEDDVVKDKIADSVKDIAESLKDIAEIDREKNILYREVAYKAGCTFGIGLFKKFQQPYFHCVDCNSQLNDETLLVCLSCAIFCHAGHKLYPGNYGKEAKVLCDCGQGKYHSCDSVTKNQKNPVIEARVQYYRDQGKKDENAKLNSSCSMLNPMYERAQEEAVNKVYTSRDNYFDIIKQNKEYFVNETDDNYDSGDLLVDLYDAFKLPKYFDTEETKKVKDQLGDQIKPYKHVDDSIEYLIDLQTSLGFSLAENVLMMAFGQPSQSFLTLLSVKKQYTINDYQNQMLYPSKSSNLKSRSISPYQTISCFVGIAQQDFYKIQKYGETLSEALGETSSKEQSSCDKICNVLRLSKGAKLPTFNLQVEPGKIIQKNHYYQLFKRLFDSKGYKIMVIHKLLQCSQKELISVLGLDGKAQNNSDLKNISDWIENELFSNILQLDEKSKIYCKHVIGLFCSHRDSFDFITKEKGIPGHKAQMYKALLNSDLKELLPLFDNLKMMIPFKFNSFMLNVWKGDTLSVLSFIVEFLKVNSEMFGSWKKFKEPKMDDDTSKDQYRYLQHLYALMSGDVQETEKSFKYIIKRMLRKTLSISEPDTYDKDKIIHEDKISFALMSASAVFYNSIIDVPKIAITIEKDTAPLSDDAELADQQQQNQAQDSSAQVSEKHLIKSLINIVNKTWQGRDIENVIKSLGKQDDFSKDSPYFIYIKNLLQATEGDLISFGKISDELLNGSDTHFKSLLTSIIAGSTKFDQMEEDYEEQQQKIKFGQLVIQDVGSDFSHRVGVYPKFNNKPEVIINDPKYSKNLLLKEMYILYEKVIKFHFSSKSTDNVKVETLLNWSYTKQIPLLMLMVLSEDKNFIDKLFDPSQSFHNNLIEDKEKLEIMGIKVNENDLHYLKFDNQKFIASLLDFIDPFTQNNNIKNVLKQALGKKQIDVTIKKIKLNPAFANVSKLGMENIKIDDKNTKVFNNLSKELSLVETEKKLTVDIFALAKLLSNCYLMDSQAIKNLYLVFKSLFDHDVIMQNLFTIVFKLFNKDKTNIFEHLPAVVAILVDNSKRQNDPKVRLAQTDEKMVLMISKWMHAIIIQLDKENKFDVERDHVKKIFFDALTDTENYYKENIPQSQDNILLKFQDLNFVADILIGTMAACKQDFTNIKPLALKIGSFPNPQLLNSFFYIIRKNKDILTFDSKSLVQTSAATIQNGLFGGDGQDDIDFSQSGMNPRQIFNYFSKKNFGKIGVEEFQELCKYMGVNLSYTRMLQIFSKVDVDKSGDLEFTEFLRGLAELKTLVIYESIERIGLSVNDLVVSFLISMMILIMTFVFIFISIQAFSTTTTFSSVTNSMLPIIAGGAVHKGSQNEDDKDEDVQEVVDQNL